MQYTTALLGTLHERWTEKKQQAELDNLSVAINQWADTGWRLHSIQPIPLFGSITKEQKGVALLGVFEAE